LISPRRSRVFAKRKKGMIRRREKDRKNL